MLGTIVFIVGIVIAAIAVGVAIRMIREGNYGVAVVAMLIGLFVGGTMTAGTTVGTVGTKKVGVVTSYNKPTGEKLSAGAYIISPWKSVTEMDAAYQTQSYQFVVQAAGGATVGLDIRPRWRMVESAAPDLFQNYKTFDGVVDNLFQTELIDASQNLFGSFNPLTAYDVKTSLPTKSKEKWSQELLDMLKQRLAGKIEFDRLSITTIAPDVESQKKLDGQLAEFGRGKILDQALINAGKQKSISEKNAEVDKETRCLEIAQEKGGEPGLCLNGGAGVILNKNK